MSMTYCGLYLDVLRNLLCGGEIMSNEQGSEKFQTENVPWDIPEKNFALTTEMNEFSRDFQPTSTCMISHSVSFQ